MCLLVESDCERANNVTKLIISRYTHTGIVMHVFMVIIACIRDFAV